MTVEETNRAKGHLRRLTVGATGLSVVAAAGIDVLVMQVSTAAPTAAVDDGLALSMGFNG